MSVLPDPPGPGASHADVTDGPLAWRAHVQALAAAAAGITQAAEVRDAVSNSFYGHGGSPVDAKGYTAGKVARDAAAWEQVEVFLEHGPEVLARVRAAAHGTDYVEGPVSEDLRRLRGIDTTLARAGQLRHEWDQVLALMDASMPGSREIYASRAQEIRNSEGWYHADALAYQGAALARAAGHLADRSENDQPAPAERVQVALARSAPGAPATAALRSTAAPRGTARTSPNVRHRSR